MPLHVCCWSQTDNDCSVLQEFEDSVKQLEVLSVVESINSDRLKLGNHRKLQILLMNLLQPFLEGYLTVCKLLQQVCWVKRTFMTWQQRGTCQCILLQLFIPFMLNQLIHSIPFLCWAVSVQTCVVLSYSYDGLTSVMISRERTLKRMVVIYAATSQIVWHSLQ